MKSKPKNCWWCKESDSEISETFTREGPTYPKRDTRCKECSDEDSARFLNIKYNKGPYALELSSAIKFGLLERPRPGRLIVSDIAKKILRPQNEQEELLGLREAALKAPEISSVYSHYRGENLPDEQFFENALVDKFGLPKEKLPEFKSIFFETLDKARLLEEHNGKRRVIDVSSDVPTTAATSATLKKLGKSVDVGAHDSCFVMMPFSAPLSTYYEKVYKPAIEKAGLKPVRADTEIFGAGQDNGPGMGGDKCSEGAGR
jgi:hypothetical protein